MQSDSYKKTILKSILLAGICYLFFLFCARQSNTIKGDHISPLTLIEDFEIPSEKEITDTTETRPPLEKSPWDDIKITMDFQNARLSDILRIIAQEYKINLEIPNDNESRVSIYLVNASIYEALETILTSADYSYEIKDQKVYIQKTNNINSKINQLRYTKSDKPRENIKELSDQTTIKMKNQTNSMLMTDTPENNSDQHFDALDSSQPSLMIEVEIFEIKRHILENLGIKWESGHDEDIFETVVTSPPQSSETYSFLRHAVLNSSQAQLLISALKKNAETQLLSSPRIGMMNEQAGKIVVGERFPYVHATVRTQDNKVLEEQEFIDVSIYLNITSRIILDEKSIFLDIEPEITKLPEKSSQNIPDYESSESGTQVTVNEKQTVVLSGLSISDDIKSKSGTSFFQKVPLAKHLFQKSNNSHAERELIIFIAPHILKQFH